MAKKKSGNGTAVIEQDEASVPMTRVGKDSESLKNGFNNKLRFNLCVNHESADEHDYWYALSLAIRDRIVDRWMKTQDTIYAENAKRVYYLSLEFLIGRSLGNNVINLGMEKEVMEAMKEHDLNWFELRDQEVDAGLGNGGLGRLAACFIESLSTLGIPATGYGLRYNRGIFRQKIINGYQYEEPDNWLRFGNPWEIARPDKLIPVNFNGKVEQYKHRGQLFNKWIDTNVILGTPYDMPVVGYGGNFVNTLRLWSAEAADEFSLDEFNKGDYISAVQAKVEAENITNVLYPNDSVYQGKELRLKQQYFFVACSLDDIIRRFRKTNGDNFELLPEKVAIQLNDTHPSLSVPELMRILMDEYELDWDSAWGITEKTIAYTNHTLLPEALEKWPIGMLEYILPRHLQLIYEINHRFLSKVAAFFPGDLNKLSTMSMVEDSSDHIRMANLSVVGSHSTNGVAALHSELLTTRVMPEFAEMYPERFNNKTNGVTQRRWLLKSNQPLANLITESIGDGWITDLSKLQELKPMAEDAAFREAYADVKRQAKVNLSNFCQRNYGYSLNPDAIFDTQIKRIHEYKRQLLNVLHIVMLFNKIHNGEIDAATFTPRAFLFGGKAAPGYWFAKLIIKLVNGVASVINYDPLVKDLIQVHFLPDYRVSLAERMIPATNISEQISTAGTEASGTGNMKFMLNGALTMGTLDGANIEIVEECGEDNAFIFGLTADQVEELRPHYNPYDYYNNNADIRGALDLIFNNTFNHSEPGIFNAVKDALLTYGDHYMHLADLQSYAEAQHHAGELYKDQEAWNRKAIINTATAGKFSSDRTIQQYADEIWGAKSVSVPE